MMVGKGSVRGVGQRMRVGSKVVSCRGSRPLSAPFRDLCKHRDEGWLKCQRWRKCRPYGPPKSEVFKTELKYPPLFFSWHEAPPLDINSTVLAELGSPMVNFT